MTFTTQMIFLVFMSSYAAADAGDDFSNNLFSDLAPLLALFGEQVAKQFMSESMGWLDHIVFAMAPLGILTALTAAIRVGGAPWLRAVIGRARENLATVELELMSSTSHEVGELSNGQGIVKTMGAPEVQEVIYLDAYKDTDTFGLYTLESAIAQRLVQERDLDDRLVSLFRKRTTGFNDQERTGKKELVCPKSAPNISLNLHGGSRVQDLVCVSVCGILVQAGVLVFTGLSVYNAGFSSRFLKNGRKVGSYAYPIMTAGTLLLTIGMIICSAVVEQSTEEKEFVTERRKEVSNCTHSTGRLKARILWLQRSHVVSDQTFNASVIFRGPRGGDETLDRILTSCRAGKPRKRRIWLLPEAVCSSTPEALTLLGVILGLCGFVLQFQGLRGLHWSASVAQLVSVGVMTGLRLWVRRHLTVLPITKDIPSEHEMDWLALWIVRGAGRGKDKGMATIDWPEDQQALHNDSTNFKLRLRSEFNHERHLPSSVLAPIGKIGKLPPVRAPERLIWKIRTNEQNLAWSPRKHEDDDGRSTPVQHVVRRQSLSEKANPVTSLESINSSTSGPRIDRADPEPSQNTAEGAIPHENIHAEARNSAPNGTTRNGGTSVGQALGDSEEPMMDAQRPLKIRQRLAQLTRWSGQAARPSVALAQAIGVTLSTLFQPHAGEGTSSSNESFSWCVNVELAGEDRKIEPITFVASKIAGEDWKADATELEAALSLWLFHIHEMLEAKQQEAKEVASRGLGERTDWLQKDTQARQRVLRLLGLDTPSLRRDISWWIQEDVGINNTKSSKSRDAGGLEATGDHNATGFAGFSGPIGFGGYASTEQFPAAIGSETQKPTLSVQSAGSLEDLLAQHLFTAFAWAVVVDERVTIDHSLTSIIPVNQGRTGETFLSIRLESKVLAELARSIEGTGLCTKQDAYLCLVPPLSTAQMLPCSPYAIVTFLSQDLQSREWSGQWEDVVPVYVQLLRECRSFGEKDQLALQATAMLLETLLLIQDALRVRVHQLQKNDLNRDLAALEKVKTEILGEFSRWRKGKSCGWAYGFAGLHLLQGRFNSEIWSSLSPNITRQLLSTKSGSGESGQSEPNLEVHSLFEPTPLMSKIITFGHTQNVVDIKANSRRDARAMDILGWTSLHYAILLPPKDRETQIRKLLNLGADPNTRDCVGRTPLYYAVLASEPQETMESASAEEVEQELPSIDMDVIRALIQGGADVEVRARDGRVPLHCAVEKGNRKATEELLRAGATIDVQDCYQQRPLHLAASTVSGATPSAVLGLLLKKGAFPGIQDRYGRTPLHLAVVGGRFGVVKQLLDIPTTPLDVKDADGNTPLHLAVLAPVNDYTVNIVQALVRHGTSTDLTTPQGHTAVHLAVIHDLPGVLDSLLALGARYDIANQEGLMALHLAVLRSNVTMLKILLRHDHIGTMIESRTNNGHTALHLAAQHGQANVTRLLIKSGASTTAVTTKGFKPLYLAAQHSHSHVVKEFLEHQVEPNSLVDCRRARELIVAESLEVIICPGAVGVAAWAGNVEILEMLRKAGADINQQFPRESTVEGHNRRRFTLKSLTVNNEARVGIYGSALSAGAVGGSIKVVEFLLSWLKDANTIDLHWHGLTVGIGRLEASDNARIHIDCDRARISGSLDGNSRMSGNASLDISRGAISAALCQGHSEIAGLLLAASPHPFIKGSVKFGPGKFTLSDRTELNIICYRGLYLQRFETRDSSTLNVYGGELAYAIGRRGSGNTNGNTYKAAVEPLLGQVGRAEFHTGTTCRSIQPLVTLKNTVFMGRSEVHVDYGELNIVQALIIRDECKFNAYCGDLSSAIGRLSWGNQDRFVPEDWEAIVGALVPWEGKKDSNEKMWGLINAESLNIGLKSTVNMEFTRLDIQRVKDIGKWMGAGQHGGTDHEQANVQVNGYHGALSLAAAHGLCDVVQLLLKNNARSLEPPNVRQTDTLQLNGLLSRCFINATQAAERNQHDTVVKLLREGGLNESVASEVPVTKEKLIVLQNRMKSHVKQNVDNDLSETSQDWYLDINYHGKRDADNSSDDFDSGDSGDGDDEGGSDDESDDESF